MDAVFHPEKRKWISAAVNLAEESAKFSDEKANFMLQVDTLKKENPDLVFKPDEDEAQTTEESTKILKPYEKLFNKSKKKKRRNSDEDDDEEMKVIRFAEEAQQVPNSDKGNRMGNELKQDLRELELLDESPECMEKKKSKGNPIKVLIDSDEGEEFEDLSNMYNLNSGECEAFKKFVQKKKKGQNRAHIDPDSDSSDSSDEDYQEDSESHEDEEEEGSSDGEDMDIDPIMDPEEDAAKGNEEKLDARKATIKATEADSQTMSNLTQIQAPVQAEPRNSSPETLHVQLVESQVVTGRTRSSARIANVKASQAPKVQPKKPPTLKRKKKDGGTILLAPGPQSQNEPVAGPSSAMYQPQHQAPPVPPPNIQPQAGTSSASGGGGPTGLQADIEKEKNDFEKFHTWGYNFKILESKKLPEGQKEMYMKGLNLDEEEFNRMQDSLNSSLATRPEEIIVEKPIMRLGAMPILSGPIPPEASKKLATLAMLKFSNVGCGLGDFIWKSPIVLDQMTMDQQITERLLKMKENKNKMDLELLKSPEDRDPGLVDPDEFITTVRVYQSFKCDDVIADELNLNLEPKFLCEIQILGSQTLAELRALISCENDYIFMKDFQHPREYDPKDPATESQLAKNTFKCELMGIGNKLYINDAENEPNSKILANNIIEWSQFDEKQKNVGPFHLEDINTTKIKDLCIRYGFPYVFIHLGNCEHLVVFTSSKIVTCEDRLKKTDYPRRSQIGKFRVANCNVDNENMAKWAVIGCDRFPTSQMMVCEECLYTYCYDPKHQKIGDFKIYPIIHIAPKL